VKFSYHNILNNIEIVKGIQAIFDLVAQKTEIMVKLRVCT